MMRLSTTGAAMAASLLWGGAILFTGLIHLGLPAYGNAFLGMIASVYPWFHGGRSIGDVLIGAMDGLVDGAVAGFLFAWLYNAFVPRSNTSQV